MKDKFFKKQQEKLYKKAKPVIDSMLEKYCEIATTEITLDNKYELPKQITPRILKAEVYNKKTKKYREVEFYTILKIIKPLKTDETLKIYY
jgi:hypothetical protein